MRAPFSSLRPQHSPFYAIYSSLTDQDNGLLVLSEFSFGEVQQLDIQSLRGQGLQTLCIFQTQPLFLFEFLKFLFHSSKDLPRYAVCANQESYNFLKNFPFDGVSCQPKIPVDKQLKDYFQTIND